MFDCGEKIFAKIRFYPHWPGKIVEKRPRNRFKLRFYPYGETSVVPANRIVPFFHYLENTRNNNKRMSNDLKLAYFSIFDDLGDLELFKVVQTNSEPWVWKFYGHLLEDMFGNQSINFDDVNGLNPKTIQMIHTIYPVVRADTILRRSLKNVRPNSFKGILKNLDVVKNLPITTGILVCYPDLIRTLVYVSRYSINEYNHPIGDLPSLFKGAASIRRKAKDILKEFKRIAIRS